MREGGATIVGELADDGNGGISGEIAVQAGVFRVEVSNSYTAAETYELTGEEQITLTLASDDGLAAESETTPPLNVEDCPPPSSVVDSFDLTSTGICRNADDSQVVDAGFELTFKNKNGKQIALREDTTYGFSAASNVAEGSFDKGELQIVAFDAGGGVREGGATIVGELADDGNGGISGFLIPQIINLSLNFQLKNNL